jgi:hypothetical protein
VWIHLDQKRAQWWAFLNMVMIFGLIKDRKFDWWAAVSFSKSLFHGVSYTKIKQNTITKVME